MPPFIKTPKTKRAPQPAQSMVVALPRGKKATLRELLDECDLLTAKRAERLVQVLGILLQNGFTLGHIGMLLRCPPVTLLHWQKKYRRGGFKLLLRQPMGCRKKTR